MIEFLADENIPPPLVRAMRDRGLDVVRAQEVGLRSRSDPILLEWAARHDRALVSLDRRTMAGFVQERVEAGLPCPGVLLVRRGHSAGFMAEELHIAAACSFPGELRDRVTYLPLVPSA